MNDDLELIEPRSMGDALAGVSGIAGADQGLGPVEGDRCADLLVDLGVHTLEGGLLRIGRLLSGGLRAYTEG